MAGKDIVIMSQKELKRVKVINEVIDGNITQKEAGEKIGICERQIRRLILRVNEEGDEGLIHKSRGKESNKKYSKNKKENVLKKCRSKYAGFGPTLCMEKLNEIEKIEISKETIRKWFIKEGIEYKVRKKGRQFRRWRERKEYFGEMIQMDGSHHDWLEGRGPKIVLMALIDDARGKIFCRFYKYEGTIPALDITKRYIKRCGIPRSIYLDRHSTYKSFRKLSIEDELAGKQMPLSQYERALKELEINVIHANSPQAKGRVERLFGTLQDRLVKEMRLNNITSIEDANKYLEKYVPAFNKKFAVKAVKETNFHRDVTKYLNLDEIFCIKEQRVLRKDFTVNYDRKFYQVLEHTVAKKVIICESVLGSIFVMCKGKRLKHKEIFPVKKEAVKNKPVRAKKTTIPPGKNPVDYSWRRTMCRLFRKKKLAA